MSEFKGTKGKWYVSKAYKTINDEKGFGIAQENGIRNSNEWDANALLISKAPEMLEMLEDVLKICDDGYIEAWEGDFEAWETELNVQMEKARELIKEAKEL
jgi:hypothetical protein